MLVGGFQITSSNNNQLSTEAFSLDMAFGIEEAYAGPCGAAGCDGADMYCTSATVIHIGNWEVSKDCKGNPPEKE